MMISSVLLISLLLLATMTTTVYSFQPSILKAGRLTQSTGIIQTSAPTTARPGAYASPASLSTSALHMARGPPRRRYQPIVKEVKPPMNEEITASQLRVVTPNPNGGKDEILGILSRAEALQKAEELGGLDLILVNNNSDPPVCKIADYSKYRYSQLKKAKEVKKNSKASELKEVKMSYKIDVHDYAVRKAAATKFLLQGNRVKCTVMFRGREVQHDKLGFELLAKLAAELDDTCVTEQGRPVREGRNLSWILTPRPEVLKRVNDQRRALDKAKKQKKAQQAAAVAAAAGEGSVAVAMADTENDGSGDDGEDEMLESDDFEAEVEEVAPKLTKAEKMLEELLGDDYL